MIQFLAPAALIGLVLLAIPVIVHLFQPRRVRQTPFSSLRWLHLTQQRLARRIKWHQILLFLLRAAFISLLVFALARPLWGGEESGKQVERFVLIDISRSMAYKNPDGETSLDQARDFATKLVNRSGAAARTAVLLVDTQTTVLSDLSRNAKAALPKLEQIRPSQGGTDLSAALPVIEAMLTQRRAEAEAEIYVITDQQRGGWRSSDVQGFAKRVQQPVGVYLIDVGATSPSNAWVESVSLLRSSSQSRAALRVTLQAQGEPVTRTVRVDDVSLSGSPTQQVTIEPGTPTQVYFELADDPDKLSDERAAASISMTPNDALPLDDTSQYLFSLDGAVRVLLVAEDVRAAAAHPVAAMRVLVGSRRRLQVTIKSPGELFPSDIQSADVVMLADVPQVSQANADALSQRCAEGAGVVIFFGPNVDIANYNAALFADGSPNRSLLPAALKAVSRPADGPFTPLQNIAWRSRLFEGLLDPTVGDASLAHVTRYVQLQSSPGATDRVLAEVDSGMPLIVSHRVGLGTAMTFTVTANDAWWDFPRKTSYVPFIERLIDELAGITVPIRFESGQPVNLVLSDVRESETVRVIDPTGTQHTPALHRVGQRTHMQLQRVAQPGIYQVQTTADERVIAKFNVLPADGDSVLTRADDKAIADSFAPCNVELLTTEAQRMSLISDRSSADIAPLILLLACLVLLGEMYLVHRLCPRVQPVVAQPLVRRRVGHRPVSHHSEAV